MFLYQKKRGRLNPRHLNPIASVGHRDLAVEGSM